MTRYRQSKNSHACGLKTGMLSLEALPLLSGDTGTPLLACLVAQASAYPRATASKICHTEAISSCSSRAPCRMHRLCILPLLYIYRFYSLRNGFPQDSDSFAFLRELSHCAPVVCWPLILAALQTCWAGFGNVTCSSINILSASMRWTAMKIVDSQSQACPLMQVQSLVWKERKKQVHTFQS